MTQRFYLVDVFAERPDCGNQLALVVDDGTLSDETMQLLAAETNYSETTFVEPVPEEDGGQGYEIRRPSLVMLRARIVDGRREVSVGGSVVPTVRGELA